VSEWDGEAYAKVNSLQQMLAAQALEGLELAGDEDVLDVGCGDGLVTAAIAARVPRGRVLGVDRSPAMIAKANQRAADVPNLRCEVQAATAMTYNREFDLAVSFNVLHWIPEQPDVLLRLGSALRPDGRALLAFVCEGERPSLEDVATSVTAKTDWRPYFEDWAPPYVHVQPEAFAATAVAAGMRVAESSVSDLKWDFHSTDAFAAWCRVGFVAWLERLPSDRSDEFVEEVLTDYAAVVGGPHIFAFLQLRATLSIQ